METPSFNTLEITVDDGIATIYLNRPDRMNAFTREMK
ncbi:MAG TPA: enoyl-CoA hydratase, partial [Alcanivorax sp.]|nr:enoyl-CoA hydratase [Alcanivorax sp.]